MYVRVVRFTDVSAERMEGLQARIEESDGPPPGVPSTGLKILYDGEQGTAVVLQHFATADDMAAGAQAFSAMDPADTPGTRATVDMCEVKLEVEVSLRLARAARCSLRLQRERGSHPAECRVARDAAAGAFGASGAGRASMQ